ncbi:hypothetical protein ABZW49_34565 [Nonomuraea wenchangensis]
MAPRSAAAFRDFPASASAGEPGRPREPAAGRVRAAPGKIV